MPKNQLSFQEQAKFHVFMYIKNHLDKTDADHARFKDSDVYVVWFCKTLQNWKALLSSTLPDGMYYEVTYNGDTCETYVDAYKKFENVCVEDELNIVSLEGTLSRAMTALTEYGLGEIQAADVMNVLLNRGFIIREKPKSNA